MLGTILVGRYQVCQILGGGGFGKTYIALDIHRPGNPQCVVKQFQPVTHNPAFMETARRLFNSEAETLERLGHHPQIPRLLAYFEENHEFFLVQEFIEGDSLKVELRPNQIWAEDKVLLLMEEILDILRFIHSHNVIHRDIKPENIIRRIQDGKLVLIDFGAVKQVQTQLSTITTQTEMTVAIGTPGYMSLEQIRGKPRLNSDIYSLGMLCIQALTGLHPRELEEDHNTREILWQHKAKVNPELASVLSKMVLNNYYERYQSATEVLEVLQENIHQQAQTQIFVAPLTLVQEPQVSLSQQQTLGLQSVPTLSVEQYNQVENVLVTLIGPIGKTLLRRVGSASSYEELIDNLALHLSENKQSEFKQKVLSLLKSSTTKLQHSNTNLPHNSQPNPNPNIDINDSFLHECEQELLDLIGPIAIFLIRKTIKSANLSISRTEFIQILANEIPDTEKAEEFQQRLLSRS